MSVDATKRIFVGGIPVRVEQDQLLEFFSQYGPISSVNRKKNTKSGRAFGYAFVTFELTESVYNVLKQPVVFLGRTLECKVAVRSDKLKDELGRRKKLRVIAYGLDNRITSQQLQFSISEVLAISHAFVEKDPHDIVNGSLIGHVVFRNEQDTQKFMNSQPQIILEGYVLQFEYVADQFKQEIMIPIQQTRGLIMKTPVEILQISHRTEISDVAVDEKMLGFESNKITSYFAENMSRDDGFQNQVKYNERKQFHAIQPDTYEQPNDKLNILAFSQVQMFKRDSTTNLDLKAENRTQNNTNSFFKTPYTTSYPFRHMISSRRKESGQENSFNLRNKMVNIAIQTASSARFDDKNYRFNVLAAR